MMEYIDFEVARKYLHEACAGLGSNGGLMLKIKFDQEPKADVVEVTRCKDCMHTEIDKYAPAECQNRCKLSQQYHEPTFFCKCGEPRTDLLEWIHIGDDDEQGV